MITDILFAYTYQLSETAHRLTQEYHVICVSNIIKADTIYMTIDMTTTKGEDELINIQVERVGELNPLVSPHIPTYKSSTMHPPILHCFFGLYTKIERYCLTQLISQLNNI